MRIQPDRRQRDPDTQVTALFSVVPDRLELREAAWALGVRFLGALCSGDPAWNTKAAARRMVERAVARCAAYDEALRREGCVPPASSGTASVGNAVTEQQG
ncbi:hypothetical protein ACIBCO_40815 [Streptomyces violascens]|uniref:hypothetical protein n=1 Tax=Streptomyces violascens TaxID=67381 RepID=UPI0037A1BB1A